MLPPAPDVVVVTSPPVPVALDEEAPPAPDVAAVLLEEVGLPLDVEEGPLADGDPTTCEEEPPLVATDDPAVVWEAGAVSPAPQPATEQTTPTATATASLIERPPSKNHMANESSLHSNKRSPSKGLRGARCGPSPTLTAAMEQFSGEGATLHRGPRREASWHRQGVSWFFFSQGK